MTKTIEKTESWIESRIKEDEIKKYLDDGKDFIPDAEILEKIRLNQNPDPQRIREILAKSLTVTTLEPDETATLLNVKDPELFQEMQEVFSTLFVGCRRA